MATERKMIQVEDGTWKRIKSIAAIQGRPIYALIEEALTKYLEDVRNGKLRAQ